MKILVVKNRALGDAILTLGAIRYLRSVIPDAQIIYATPRWIAPLFSHVKTAADGYAILPKGFKEHLAFLKWLWFEKFDYVLDFHPRTSSGRFFTLCSKLFGHGYFYHNHHCKKPGFVHDQGVIKANIQRDLDFAWCFVSKVTKNQSLALPHYLKWTPILAPQAEKTHQITLGIVATRAAKMWPLEYYAELVTRFEKNFPHYKIVIPLSHSWQDRQLEFKFKMLCLSQNYEFVFLPLEKLPATVAQSRFYIGNDTGLKHLAVALGVKTFTFFGPEEPQEWHPYDFEVHPVFFKKDMPCRYQISHYCGLAECDHHSCLRTISVDDVWQTLAPLL